jgi:hypothetical protein
MLSGNKKGTPKPSNGKESNSAIRTTIRLISGAIVRAKTVNPVKSTG